MNNENNENLKLWEIRPSNIEGEGVFVKSSTYKGTKIDTAINFALGIFPNISFFASKINHSYNPSATLVYNDEKKIYNVYARHDLKEGTEVTLDYRETPFYIQGPKKHYI